MGRPPTHKTPEEKRAARNAAHYRYQKTEKFKQNLARYRARHPRRMRSIRLKSLFGITIDQWEAIFNLQGQRCAICKRGDPNHKNGWATDHCHATGVVRSILCQSCNSALGLINESATVSRALTEYIETICEPIRQRV